MSCNDGITNMTLSTTAATATHRPHQRTSSPAATAMPTSCAKSGQPFDEQMRTEDLVDARRAPTGCPDRRGTGSPCSAPPPCSTRSGKTSMKPSSIAAPGACSSVRGSRYASTATPTMIHQAAGIRAAIRGSATGVAVADRTAASLLTSRGL